MINFLKKLFFGETTFDSLIEGVYAHQYTDANVRKQIQDRYLKKFNPEITPFNNPEKFDPLNPPKGWAYDPYYETWIKFNE